MLSESDEMDLASELLNVTTEAELDQFLGSLVSKAASAIGSAIRSPIGQAVGGVLKSAAKKALPLAGGALGGYIGGPLGAKIGSGLASAAGSALGLEAESLTPGGSRVRRREAVRAFRGEHREERRGGAPDREPRGDRPGRRNQRGQAAAAGPDPARRAGLPPADAARPADGCGGAGRSFSTACRARCRMSPFAAWTLTQEARALLTRLARVRPFAMLEPMVPAAALLPQAQSAIEDYLVAGRRTLRSQVQQFMAWVRGQGQRASNAQAQRRFSILRLKFNAVLTQFDLFSDVITQRSEHDTGVWLSGLDVASADALTLAGSPVAVPPVICYLDRGAGAAIRRARTRLPGGGTNPVAVIRVPRERMVGSGIASSLFHEVGHQADALLGISESLRPVLRGMQRPGQDDAQDAAQVWQYLERCISEIVADFFSVARVGISASIGLIGVVSLPRAFVFRLNLDDPHPVPWIRVKLSCAMGEALHPHPQWRRLADLWESFYPIAELDDGRRTFFDRLAATIPAFVSLLAAHRPPTLARAIPRRRARGRGAAAGAAGRALPGVVADPRKAL